MKRTSRPRYLLTAALTACLVAVGAVALAPAYADTTDPAPQPAASSVELKTTVTLEAECIEGYTVLFTTVQVDLAGGPRATVDTIIDGVHGNGRTTAEGYYQDSSRVTPGLTSVSVSINSGTPIMKTIDTTKTCSPEPTPTPTETSTPTPTTEPSQTPAPAATPTASLSRSTAAPDTQLTVTGSGFTAGESIELWLHSTPVKLATVTTAADGSFSQAVTVPEGTEPGAHTIEVRSANSGSISLALSVVPGLAVTGLDPVATGVSGGMGVLLLAAGVVMVLLARRRRLLGQR